MDWESGGEKGRFEGGPGRAEVFGCLVRVEGEKVSLFDQGSSDSNLVVVFGHGLCRKEDFKARNPSEERFGFVVWPSEDWTVGGAEPLKIDVAV